MINLSEQKPSDDQNTVLTKRLKYTVTRNNVPVEEFVIVAEQATRSLPQEQKASFGQTLQVSRITESPKTESTRTRKNNAEGVSEGEVHHHIPFIMEKEEYQEKITKLLSDKLTYEKRKKDPTRNDKAELIRMFPAMEKEVKITQK